MPTAVTPHGLRTREALLDAGRALAEAGGLQRISVNAIVKEAGVAKGTFYVHFADRAAFVDALRLSFRRRVHVAVSQGVEGKEPGRERLLAGIEGYLDASLADRAVKSMLREARADATIATADTANDGFASLVERNLKAMGWPATRISARLIVAMAAEVALAELEAGRRQPAARDALRRMIAA
jgi:AcrR family transcriptional regulator